MDVYGYVMFVTCFSFRQEKVKNTLTPLLYRDFSRLRLTLLCIMVLRIARRYSRLVRLVFKLMRRYIKIGRGDAPGFDQSYERIFPTHAFGILVLIVCACPRSLGGLHASLLVNTRLVFMVGEDSKLHCPSNF